MKCDNCPNDQADNLHEYEAGNISSGLYLYWICKRCIEEESAVNKKIMYFQPTGNTR